MTELGVFFGSRAAEHDVSIITGLQLLENADRSKYRAYPVYIARDGAWYTGEPLRSIKTYKSFDPDMKGIERVFMLPEPGHDCLYTYPRKGLFSGRDMKIAAKLDCALFAFHGMNGEDGSMQGLFQLAGVPFSSSGLTGSALGMDKIAMKEVFRSMGIPTPDSRFASRDEWKRDRNVVLARFEELGSEIFVKPASLGSSIGISKATDAVSLEKAIEVAFSFDRRVIAESAVANAREINCACIGFGGENTVSLCEEPASWGAFLDFDTKYLSGGKGQKGMDSMTRRIPAPIPDDMTALIRKYTSDIFDAFDCKGVVRVDYILDGGANKVYVNEINTIPGSMAFYLFEPMGLSFRQLVDKLVEYAYYELAQKNESTFAYTSDLLTKAASGTKTIKK